MSESAEKEKPAAAVDLNAVKTTPYSWFVAMMLFMSYGVSNVIRNVWSTAIPVAHESLGITMAAAGGLMTAFFIGYVISNFVTGFVVDMIGPRITLTLATLFAGIFTFLIPYTPHYPILFLLRVGAGFASGPLFAGVAKYQISYFSPQTRATAMAVMMAGSRMGVVVASAVFAPIIQNQSWQHGFTYGGLVAIGVAVIFYIFAKEQGAGLQRSIRAKDPAQKAAQAAGLKEVIANKSFILGTIACFLNIGANQGYTTYLVLFLTRTRGFSLIEAGAIVGGTFAVGLVSGPVSGIVADVLKSKKKVCVAGSIVTVVLTILIIVANSVAFLIVVLAVRVLLSSLLGTPLNALQSQAAAGPYVGRAMGIYNGVAQIGSVLFPLVFGFILDMTGMNFGVIFIVITAAVGIVGFLITFMDEKIVPRKAPEPAKA
jgi:sugar phosphate permease